MRILLVEDDRMIGEALAETLRNAAYAVDWVEDGIAASDSIETGEYELVLLDLGLPRQDGLLVLQHIRANDNPAPVLIITARDTVEERIHGLDLGADDYLVKPFAVGELLARMRAIIRRKAGNAVPLLNNGFITLDLNSKEATCGERRCRLSAREFSLMHALLIRPGAILSRDELENRIYGWNEEVESNAVEFLIHSIRKKLGSDSIRNVRGIGWMADRSG